MVRNQPRSYRLHWIAIVLMAWSAAGCDRNTTEHSLLVTVTAYNSVPSQTLGDPFVAAWGDRLEPGMKAVAVSHDLLSLGLRRGVSIEIEGLDGEYLVLDKTAGRFRERVDLYMGLDVEAAKAFGVQQRRIFWSE